LAIFLKTSLDALKECGNGTCISGQKLENQHAGENLALIAECGNGICISGQKFENPHAGGNVALIEEH
jgi:hypothetical protein